MAREKIGNWHGADQALLPKTGTEIYVRPYYALYADKSDTSVKAGLSLKAKIGDEGVEAQGYSICLAKEGHTINDLTALLPIRIYIEILAGTEVYSTRTKTLLSTNAIKVETDDELRLCTPTSWESIIDGTAYAQNSLSIPYDSEITIRTTITTNSNSSSKANIYTPFTQKAYGPVLVSIGQKNKWFVHGDNVITMDAPLRRSYPFYFIINCPPCTRFINDTTERAATSIATHIGFWEDADTPLVMNKGDDISIFHGIIAFDMLRDVSNKIADWYFFSGEHSFSISQYYISEDFVESLILGEYEAKTAGTQIAYYTDQLGGLVHLREPNDSALNPQIKAVTASKKIIVDGTDYSEQFAELCAENFAVEGKTYYELAIDVYLPFGATIKKVEIEDDWSESTTKTVTQTGTAYGTYANVIHEEILADAFKIAVTTTDYGNSLTYEKIDGNWGWQPYKVDGPVVKAYSEPEIKSLTAYRCNSNGALNEDGNWIKAIVKAEGMNLSNKPWKVRLYQNGVLKLTQDYLDTSLTEHTAEVIFEADTAKSWQVKAELEDDIHALESAISEAVRYLRKTIYVDTKTAVMEYTHSGDENGIAFGKVAETLKRLDVRADWTLRAGDVQIMNYNQSTGASQRLKSWMKQIETQISALENRT